MAQSNSSKVGIIGLIALIIVTALAPNFLPIFFIESSVMSNVAVFGTIVVAALVVGLFVGMKLPEQKDRIKNAVGIGLFTCVFMLFVILPSRSVTVTSSLMWAGFLIVPTLVGSLIGGAMKK